MNVVVAGKQPQADWLSVEDAALHCARGAGIWEWASSDGGPDILPDVVLACAGDVPALETLAAASILRAKLPDLRVRVVNVVDLMRLLPDSEHPHGLPDSQFNTLFTEDWPVIFAFHGYQWLVHRLTYRRRNHDQMHVRGYKEKGTTTTLTSASINPGNSGGALVNASGQVIGIPALAGASPQGGSLARGISFAIPSGLARDITREIIASGRVINCRRASGVLAAASPGEQVTLTLTGGSQDLTISVRLGELPGSWPPRTAFASGRLSPSRDHS